MRGKHAKPLGRPESSFRNGLLTSLIVVSVGLVGLSVLYFMFLRPGIDDETATKTVTTKTETSENPEITAAPETKKAISEQTDDAADSQNSSRDYTTQIAALEQRYGATIQVSWVDNGQVRTAGSLTDLPAWSTSKVPLAMAVYAGGQGDAQAGNISAAIQASDNAAAEALWASLAATDTERAAAVTAILRQAGDETTTVPSTRTFGTYTIFGQTQWSTSAQVNFLLNFDSLPGAAQVKQYMYGAYANQRWGIGTFANCAVKGGWGPTAWGGYTARQFGWFDRAGQQVPVAIAVQAGSFQAATQVVDAVAALLR